MKTFKISVLALVPLIICAYIKIGPDLGIGNQYALVGIVGMILMWIEVAFEVFFTRKR